jgi:hypothetical protein
MQSMPSFPAEASWLVSRLENDNASFAATLDLARLATNDASFAL